MDEDRQNTSDTLVHLEHEFLLIDHEIRKTRHHDLRSALGTIRNGLELISTSTDDQIVLSIVELAENGLEAADYLLNYNLDVNNVEYKRRHSLNTLTDLVRREISQIELGFFQSPSEKDELRNRSVMLNTGMLVQLIHLIVGSHRDPQGHYSAVSLTVKESSLKWTLEFKSRMRLSQLNYYKLGRAYSVAKHSNLENRWRTDNLVEAVATRVPAKVRQLVIDESETSATVTDIVEVTLEA